MAIALPSRVETVIVGAGQAGLTMSWHLQQAGREHVLLERRSALGGGWQDRWDAFRLVGPNWTTSFPGDSYDGDDRDAFMPRGEIIARVAGYAGTIAAPVVLDAGVERLGAVDGGFEIETTQGRVGAASVIVATGGFHTPRVPAMAADLPSRILSLHAHHYSNTADLPPGGVLLVGSGQTGVQLAEELLGAGREVFLCVGSAGRVPRRYRGRDIFYWLWRMAEDGERVGVSLPTADQLPDPRGRLGATPQLSGHGGGHETDLRRIGRDGAVLLGRLQGIEGTRIHLGPDLPVALAAADRFFGERFQGPIDAFIAAAGIEAPPADPPLITDYEPGLLDVLDLDAVGISTVIWTSGYVQDYAWIEPPITDEMGFVRQHQGLTEVPGLSVIGSLWQHDQTSATLVGLQRDARVLAAQMGLGR